MPAPIRRHVIPPFAAVAALAIVLSAFVLPASAQTAQWDLARARTAYNERRFDEAVIAATAARQASETADTGTIVLARALLERYRERADPSDLSAAREVLGTVRTVALEERDQLELLLAFGEALFLEDDFGAAAEVLESGLNRASIAAPEIAEAMLEWWGSALERKASGLAPEQRKAHFTRLAQRMQEELARMPASLAASYWSVVGLRGAGELDRAWDAAVAAWVRARLAGERSASLRADLDHLMLQGVIPDRVGRLEHERRPAAESQMKAEWELVKERWK
jgi:hypothetical protein